MTTFKTVKEVKQELNNNCFYIYVVISESKFRIYDIRVKKGKCQVKTIHTSRFTQEPKTSWFDCELAQLVQQ